MSSCCQSIDSLRASLSYLNDSLVPCGRPWRFGGVMQMGLTERLVWRFRVSCFGPIPIELIGSGRSASILVSARAKARRSAPK